MKFKEIKNKATYLKKNSPFYFPPRLTEKKHCLHCGEDIIVGDYKVQIIDDEEYIVCPNAPKCDGSIIDWVDA